MKNSTRKILDTSFTAVSLGILFLLILSVAAFIVPIVVRGINAVIFTATVEHDKFRVENLDADLTNAAKKRIADSEKSRAEIYAMMDEYESADSVKILSERIQTARRVAVSNIRGYASSILGAAKLDPRARSAAVRGISVEIFEKYTAEISSAEAECKRMGKTYSFGIFLKNEVEVFQIETRNAVSKICSEMKIPSSVKSAVRRNMSEPTAMFIADILRRLTVENAAYETFKKGVRDLLGPRNAADKGRMILVRQKYGQTRLDVARKVFENSVEQIGIKKKATDGSESLIYVRTKEYFFGTPVEKIFDALKNGFDKILVPHTTVYTGFFTDHPVDSNIFGGIYPMIAGTFYLTFGAMLIAAPLGIVAAVYFTEYARGGRIVWILEMCVGTLAGVPSIVFGLFGLAFLINTVKISEGKSVVAGAATLALLILPTIIRSGQEALRAVPNSYREAAYGLGAGKWRAICGVIIPAALPSMLTGIIISMGRAAGETAPIIFTAATSTGFAIAVTDIFSQPTPALPWNIYNICSEHELAERVEHVQYGMVFTLMIIVLSLNLGAIWLRAKLQRTK